MKNVLDWVETQATDITQVKVQVDNTCKSKQATTRAPRSVKSKGNEGMVDEHLGVQATICLCPAVTLVPASGRKTRSARRELFKIVWWFAPHTLSLYWFRPH